MKTILITILGVGMILGGAVSAEAKTKPPVKKTIDIVQPLPYCPPIKK